MPVLTFNQKEYVVTPETIQTVVEDVYRLADMTDPTLIKIELRELKNFIEDNSILFVKGK